MIPVEIRETSTRKQQYVEKENNQCLATHLDLLLEVREKARIQEKATKRRVARRYNSKEQPRKLNNRDLFGECLVA